MNRTLRTILLIFFISIVFISCSVRPSITVTDKSGDRGVVIGTAPNEQFEDIIKNKMRRKDRVWLNGVFEKGTTNEISRRENKNKGIIYKAIPSRPYVDKIKKGKICREAEIQIYGQNGGYPTHYGHATACRDDGKWTIQ